MNIDCKKQSRRGGIYLRILLLIDTLAPLRHGKTSRELVKIINESAGESYSERTIRRDLEIMSQLGFVRREDRPKQTRGSFTVFWSLNMRRSEQLQNVAFEAIEVA
jgi:repressor of nif and glnA expression